MVCWFALNGLLIWFKAFVFWFKSFARLMSLLVWIAPFARLILAGFDWIDWIAGIGGSVCSDRLVYWFGSVCWIGLPIADDALLP